MIQFYINSRPVPKALARHRIQEANPQRTIQELEKIFRNAIHEDPQALHFLRAYGVDIQRS